MIRVIIESPYAGMIERNTIYARMCLRDSLDKHEAPFASHLLYTQVLDDTDEQQRLQGIQAGYEWTEKADLIAFYIDYGWSPGMIRALKIARIFKRKIEVRHILGRQSPREPLEVRELLQTWELTR